LNLDQYHFLSISLNLPTNFKNITIYGIAKHSSNLTNRQKIFQLKYMLIILHDKQ